MKPKPDFAAFASASLKSLPQSATVRGNVTKHLQVRLLKPDAVRFRRAAEERAQTIQAALIDAINLYLRDSDESPVPDPGTGSSKHKADS